MAKADNKETQAIEPENSIDEFPLPIDEFCASLSITDRRVELIGAFHSDEKRNGRFNDTRTAFMTRYAAFINAPA